MAYASLTSILDIVPGMPQTTTATGYTTASLVIGRHIVRADSVINSTIAKRYAVPISPTPPFLATISEDMTVYYTYRSFYYQDNHNKMEYFEELKDNALADLKLIREGQIDLVDSTGSIIPESTADKSTSLVDSNTIDAQSFFDIDDSLDWKFNDDLEDSVRDGR